MPLTGVQEKKLDTDRSACTMLPIELDGVEVVLEARAYQGKDEHTQAMALINRGKGAVQLRKAQIVTDCHA